MSKTMKNICACWATVVGLGMIIGFVLFAIDKTEFIETYFYFHFTIGAVLVFLIFWPFYSKRLK